MPHDQNHLPTHTYYMCKVAMTSEPLVNYTSVVLCPTHNYACVLFQTCIATKLYCFQRIACDEAYKKHSMLSGIYMFLTIYLTW